MVVWLTGLSGAGKSTISELLLPLMRQKFGSVLYIDGDIIREMFGSTLGYDVPSRIVQIKRIQALAKFASDQHITVLVAALYSNPELLDWNRENLHGYFEVYVDTPIDVLRVRDTKGLYQNALDGLKKNVVGVDIDWVAPQNPDLVVNTTNESASKLAQCIFQAVLST